MNLKQASEIASKVIDQLSPHCTICLVGGSIRREKPEVKDIEIICQPKIIVGGADNLFDEGTRYFMRDPKFVKAVLGLGKIVKGQLSGKYIKIELEEGINLDLFIPEDYDFWRIFVIRTGSAEWVQRHIAGGWRKIGWVGSDKGLRKIPDCEKIKGKDGKVKYKCVNKNPELPPVWKSEVEFLNWLGIDYIEPKNRK